MISFAKVRKPLKTRVASNHPVCGRNKDDICGPWILDLGKRTRLFFPERKAKTSLFILKYVN